MFRRCLAGRPYREILARHSCLHPILTLRIPACASHMGHFEGCLVARYLRKLFSFQLLESSHSLSLYYTTLTIKSHNKYRVQKIE